MGNIELLQTQDPDTAPRKVINGGAAHAAHADHHHIVRFHSLQLSS
jgi:hypothetical protein